MCDNREARDALPGPANDDHDMRRGSGFGRLAYSDGRLNCRLIYAQLIKVIRPGGCAVELLLAVWMSCSQTQSKVQSSVCVCVRFTCNYHKVCGKFVNAAFPCRPKTLRAALCAQQPPIQIEHIGACLGRHTRCRHLA